MDYMHRFNTPQFIWSHDPLNIDHVTINFEDHNHNLGENNSIYTLIKQSNNLKLYL